MKIVERKFLKTSTRSVHAASIDFFKGHPVFAWFGGYREGSPDTSIFVHNLLGEEDTITVGSKESIAHWNPVLFSFGENHLYMFEKAGEFCDRWQTFLHDLTLWGLDTPEKEINSCRQVLAAGLNGPVKNRPIIVDNRIFCGSSVETIYDWASYIEEYSLPSNGKFNINEAFIRRSVPLFIPEKVTYADRLNGRTCKSLGIIQPTLWYDGVVHALFRSSRGLNKVYYSCCYGGVWEKPAPTNLENPNSSISCVWHNDKLFLANNPNENVRSPLVINNLSLDYNKSDGEKVWLNIEDTLVITNEVTDLDVLSSELSYPYMIEKDGFLHLVYTYGRSKIEYVVIDIN